RSRWCTAAGYGARPKDRGAKGICGRLLRAQGLREAGAEPSPVLELALVDGERPPAHCGIGGERLFVARPVTGDLGAPIVGVGLRHAGAARAIVPVPEAAVDEDGEFSPDVNDVRLARQVGAIQPVAGCDRP